MASLRSLQVKLLGALLVFAFLPILFSSGSTRAAQSSVTVTSGRIATLVAGPPQSQVGRPYSLEQETETTRTLADGTRIVTKTRLRMYRDSQGRTRREFFGPDFMAAREGSQEPSNVNITDPIEGEQYSLNPQSRTGMRNPFGPRGVPPPQAPKPAVNVQPPPPPRELMPHVQSEQLGTQMIEGMWAKGTRTTTTIPANSEGNDRPIVIVNENWLSEELGMVVLSKRSDPRNGETITRVIHIDRSEPDPALFRPPADYTISEPQRFQ